MRKFLAILLIALSSSVVASVIEHGGNIFIPSMPTIIGTGPNLVSTLIDADFEKAGSTFLVESTITISQIAIPFGTTTTGSNMDVNLETTNSSGLPSGTLACTGSSVTLTTVNTDDNVNKLSGNFVGGDCTLSPGILYAWYINRPNGSALNANGLNYADNTIGYGIQIASNSTAGWVKTVGSSRCVAFLKSDGTYWIPSGHTGMSNIQTVTFSNTSTPDERGNYFKYPFGFESSGFWVWIDSDGNYLTKLLDVDANIVIATGTVTTAKGATTASAVEISYWDGGKVFVKPFTSYRIVVEPTSATTVSVFLSSYTINAVREAENFGLYTWSTSAKNPTNSTSWQDGQSQIFLIGLISPSIDTFVGGSYGVQQ